MIFGRKSRRTADEVEEVEVTDDEQRGADEVDDPDDDLDAADLEDEAGDDIDPRADGPFDYDEVDLTDDAENGIERLAFGPVIVTTFDGMNIQLHGDQQTGTIQALLMSYENSGLELALFAAPRSDGLADELRESTVEETGQAGGHAEEASGPFGTEVRRVLPLEGPEGEQLFHVSRIWFVEGPRWLLRGTLMGQAAMSEGEQPPADLFVEFFRNVIVQRDEHPRVPGELIPLALPEGQAAQG